MRENRETPAAPVARVRGGPVGEGHKPQDPHERSWGVGQTSSTNKVPEQRSGEETSDASAEGMEGRRLTKRNSDEDRTHRTPSRTEGVPGLERVRAAARRDKKQKFTALLHHVSVDLLRDSYDWLNRNAAPGVDDVNWLLDADIRGFFDNMSHEWLMKFVEYRIADRRILRLIQKWLKAGVSEEGQWQESRVGTPQGAVASPMLANLYLHYAFDLWANQWREKTAQGDMIVVRYADDIVLGFERRKEAEAFLEQMGERMRKFGLELHAEKTRLIEFGRYAAENRERRGEGRPETFNFLGFTHMCEKARRGGWFKVQRQTIKKRWRSTLQAVKQELRQRMHEKVTATGKWLKSVVLGYFNYHAVPGNLRALRAFRGKPGGLGCGTLRGGSHRFGLTWKRFAPPLTQTLPP